MEIAIETSASNLVVVKFLISVFLQVVSLEG